MPLNFYFFNQSDVTFYNSHTAFKPLIKSFIKQNKNDSLLNADNSYFTITHKNNRSFLSRKLFFENLIQVDSGQYAFTVDPLLNLEVGHEMEDSSGRNYYTNTRGFLIKGYIGYKFAFVSSFKENQSVFPNYYASIVDSLKVVPGQGRSKSFKDNGFDYAQATGAVMYQVADNALLQLGTDKFFIGNGYRSMLLSDASHSYPYIGGTVYFKDKKIQYNAYYADLIHLQRRPYTNSPEALFYRKGMNFHYISIKPADWIELGLFDNVIIQKMDSTGSKPFNFISLNPVPFLPLALYGFNTDNNASVGMNLKLSLKRKTVFYAQYFYDGKRNNATKQAYQIGLKTFTIKHLGLGVEYNVAAPFTYISSNASQAYSHYNQSLANPIGSNFNEYIIWLSFLYNRWFIFGKINQINQNLAGGNILKNEGNLNINTSLVNKSIVEGNAGYIINFKTNLSINFGTRMWRYTENNLQKTATYIYFGIKTNLQNIYYDF
jgi:hypothetical protein